MELKEIIKDAVTIAADATFKDAVSLMIDRQTNTLLVTDDAGLLVGEVAVTDLLDAVVPAYLDDDAIAAHFATSEMFQKALSESADKLIKDFMMTPAEPHIAENDSLMAVAQTAIANKSARIPVVDNEGKPIGIISRRGLKFIIAEYLGIIEPNHSHGT